MLDLTMATTTTCTLDPNPNPNPRYHYGHYHDLHLTDNHCSTGTNPEYINTVTSSARLMPTLQRLPALPPTLPFTPLNPNSSTNPKPKPNRTLQLCPSSRDCAYATCHFVMRPQRGGGFVPNPNPNPYSLSPNPSPYPLPES